MALTPHTDSSIARKYSSSSLDQKVVNKTALQEEIGWPAEPRRPMLCFPAGMSEKLGGALFQELLSGLLALPIEVIIIGKGSANYGTLFTKLSKDHSHRMHILHDSEENQHKMFAAADMALFLSDPASMKELSVCLHYGVVPVSLPCAALEDYDPVQESGNAFLYEKPDAWLAFASLVRATETYKLPFDWRTIQKHGMETAS